MWENERIVIVDYDPAWPVRAERLRAELTRLLSCPIEHFGSTAVPGLAAKPIIDLMALAPERPSEDLVSSLSETGWHHVPPDLDGREWRKFFVLVVDGVRSAHFHVVDRSSERWSRQLEFRDALRRDPALRDAYSALKRSIAVAHAGDREAYSEAKTAFIVRALDGG